MSSPIIEPLTDQVILVRVRSAQSNSDSN